MSRSTVPKISRAESLNRGPGQNELYREAAAPDAFPIIWKLRLLVARGAQPDSLHWWDDSSLTQEGMYVVERLFPRAPRVAAAKIALAAAKARHWSAIRAAPEIVHLFDLGDQVEFELAALSLDETWVHDEALTLEQLTDEFAHLCPAGFSSEVGSRTETGAIETHLSPDSALSIHPGVLEACALASVYMTRGVQGKPIFPYLRRSL
jgi:hypothetical protein